ncbi:MAG TPA: STAS domain-containing protein [Burkholderiaceae bacterium]|nr:STAS domain-containing protein [Burkholderiaceae bacterium]
MNSTTTLRLDGDLNIQAAASTRETLRAALAQSRGDLVLDLSLVQGCDSAGVQLLLAARRTLAARGRALRLAEPAPAVVEALTTLGLQALLPARNGAPS